MAKAKTYAIYDSENDEFVCGIIEGQTDLVDMLVLVGVYDNEERFEVYELGQRTDFTVEKSVKVKG